MRSYSQTLTLEHRGCEFEIRIDYDYAKGGSNSHGSDEPAWEEATFDVGDFYSEEKRTKGNKLSERLQKEILSKENEYQLGEYLLSYHVG